jgi:hypothetical protein
MPTPELNKALVAARKEIKNPKFDSLNPHFKSKFASLKSVIEATVDVAAKHGIAVHQDLQEAEGGMRCYTHLCHESGEEKTFGPLYFPCTKQDAQGYASASTYARRYHLMGVFAVVGDVDDDGNAASQENKMPKKQASEIARLLDEANPETGEGVDAFGEAWIELGEPVQRTFAPWISTFYPGQVSGTKAKMHSVMRAYRERKNNG